MQTIFVRTKDKEVKDMLEGLAKMDVRSASAEVVWLIRQEWLRRMRDIDRPAEGSQGEPRK